MKWPSIFLLVLAACNPKTDTTTVETTAVETTATTATTAAPPAKAETASPVVREERNITIEAVEIANPLVVRGTARTFENNVILRARAADRKIIRETFTTATGEMGQHSPYTGSLWLTEHPGQSVVVEAIEYSA